MKNCLFCQIAQGKTQTPGIFYEDDEFMAFLSIYPNTEGFSVVITKEHHDSDVFKLPDDVLQKFILIAKKVAKKLENHFPDVGRVGLIAEGTGIHHAHFKLFPMHGTAHLKQGIWKPYHSLNKRFFTQYEGYISSNDSEQADFKELRKLAEALRRAD